MSCRPLAGYILLLVSWSLFIAACVPATLPAATPAPPPADPAAASLAAAGQTVFANNCVPCHGASGEGVTAPAIIGPEADLARYKTARGLLDFVSGAMPQGSPGSLTGEEYLQVVVFLLVQNEFIDPDTPLDAGKLAGISLER